jgi:hypothetical protein
MCMKFMVQYFFLSRLLLGERREGGGFVDLDKYIFLWQTHFYSRGWGHLILEVVQNRVQTW